MSCFLRASVLLSNEQSGTVHMANKYKLAGILNIYINHSTRTEEAGSRYRDTFKAMQTCKMFGFDICNYN